jgi:hypothetical protein
VSGNHALARLKSRFDFALNLIVKAYHDWAALRGAAVSGNLDGALAILPWGRKRGHGNYKYASRFSKDYAHLRGHIGF